MDCAKSAASCARALAAAGYDAIIVENFGDVPFFAGKVPPVTVAAMTACALAVREAAPAVPLGINVLRNDAEAALSIALCANARFVRVNVHTGARVTDQGVIQGDAAATLRLRRALGADSIAIWADVDVKHSAPLGPPRPIAQEVEDTTKRAMAEAVLVTGEGTGKGVDLEKLAAVKRAAGTVPVLVASGATLDTLSALAAHASGVVVGSALRIGGVPGGPVDATLAKTFADAFRRAFGEGG
jgi:membrane complex biogenesis BtpA family protein